MKYVLISSLLISPSLKNGTRDLVRNPKRVELDNLFLVLPVALVRAEGEGKVCGDLLKVLQRDVAVHIQVVVLHDRL